MLNQNSTKLDSETLKAWQDTIIAFARKPKNIDDRRSAAHPVAAIAEAERENIRRLWQIFTEERSQLNSYLYDPKKQTVAYLLGFHLANLARCNAMLERIAKRNFLFWSKVTQGERLELFDFGCGTGALSQSLVQFLKHRKFPVEKIKIHLWDNKGAFLDAARFGLQALGIKEQQIFSRKVNIDDRVLANFKTMPGAPQIFLFGYFWNEILRNIKAQNAWLNFFAHANAQNAPQLLLFVDSANQSVARAMMQLRDSLVEAGYQAEYPCSHSLACPMLARSRDWCYSEATWQLPPIQQKIDRILKVDRRVLSASAYALSSQGLPTATKDIGKQIVVGRPLDKRAFKKYFYLLCNREGLEKSKPKSERNDSPQLRGMPYA